jgi:hypothetical protein
LEWQQILGVCAALPIPRHPFPFLRTFLIASLADRNPRLANKVRRFRREELDDLCAALKVLQKQRR